MSIASYDCEFDVRCQFTDGMRLSSGWVVEKEVEPQLSATFASSFPCDTLEICT